MLWPGVVNIQNGSDVEITLVAYTTVKGVGTRLQSLDIIKMADRPDQMSENKQIEKASEPVVETKSSTDKKVPW